ncbi:hypothetical protein BH11VER1_BH11VER1_17240 [soil metagenome]
MSEPIPVQSVETSHRFMDEAGDTTFFGRGKIPIIGQLGVSLSFSIGMVKFGGALKSIREQIISLQQEIVADRYLNRLPSIAKKINGKGFYFHATDDPPEVRERFFKFIDSLDCTIEVMVARKIPALFVSKHNGQDSEFYADVLSHLLKNNLQLEHKLVLNIAERGNSTKNVNLDRALAKAVERHSKKHGPNGICCSVVFNVQNHYTEPLLNVADYLCWSVQRVFERGETRYYDFMENKVSLVVDLYDSGSYGGSKNYYTRKNRLTAVKKLSPPSP